MSDDKEEDGISNILNTVKDVADFLDENSEMIDGIVGGSSGSEYKGELSHLDPLKEVTKTDDAYEVIMEVDEDGSLDIELTEGDDHVIMRFAGNKYKVNVPSSALISDADAQLNNGVLTVKMPIDEEEDSDVTVSVNENDEQIDGGGE